MHNIIVIPTSLPLKPYSVNPLKTDYYGFVAKFGSQNAKSGQEYRKILHLCMDRVANLGWHERKMLPVYLNLKSVWACSRQGVTVEEH